ncbi:hypothetical protein F6W79_19050 [Vibrio diabolicus]|nr:hypothetical protein F6W79_19050 [Vibrio diabolicus]
MSFLLRDRLVVLVYFLIQFCRNENKVLVKNHLRTSICCVNHLLGQRKQHQKNTFYWILVAGFKK